MSSTLSTVIDELSCSRRARDRRDTISSTSSTNSHAASRRSRTGKTIAGSSPRGAGSERGRSTNPRRDDIVHRRALRRTIAALQVLPRGRADDASHDSSSITCSTVCLVDPVGRRDTDVEYGRSFSCSRSTTCPMRVRRDVLDLVSRRSLTRREHDSSSITVESIFSSRFRAARSLGKWRYPATFRSRGSMSKSAVASQRWRWLEFCQWSTFAQRSSTSALTDSRPFVVLSDRPSTPNRPRRWSVTVSSRPSARLPAGDWFRSANSPWSVVNAPRASS